MARFDHLALPIRDLAASRDWYVKVLGLTLEFEALARHTAAVRDAHDFTVFLHEAQAPPDPSGFVLYFQVEDVDARYRDLRDQGIAFDHPPMMVDWGYGAQLTDPSGYVVCLWDDRTMPKERSPPACGQERLALRSDSE